MLKMFQKDRKFGLALGGGAFRGWAHIGALKVLEDEGIKIDYLAGTSMGAIIGALYASGMSAEELKEGFKKLSPLKIVDIDFSWQGMLSSKKIEKQLGKALKAKQLGDLQIPLRVVATDFKKGEEFVFKDNNVNLVQALCASSAVPALFAPYNYQNKILVDGCLTNNLPVSVVKEMGADVVMGVNLNPGRISKEPKDLQTVLTWSNDIFDNSKMATYQKQADIIISPISEYVNTFYFSSRLENVLLKAGERAMRSKLPLLKKKLRLK